MNPFEGYVLPMLTHGQLVLTRRWCLIAATCLLVIATALGALAAYLYFSATQTELALFPALGAVGTSFGVGHGLRSDTYRNLLTYIERTKPNS